MAVTEALRNALPDYDVEREIGRGAMGVVYLGRHRSLDRPVAIKELSGNFAADPGVRERFTTEARVLAGLDHPHIVPVYDFVERDGQLLIVMQTLPGGTLWDAFVETGLTMPNACAVTLATCAGLSHAHDKGVLHRDVKPENLMFDDAGSLKVTDFGIAKVMSGAVAMATIDGSVLGTPAYMAPEQASGEPVGTSADTYATGAMLFELLSGRLPFLGGDTPIAMLVQRINEDAPALQSVAPCVPPSLASAVDKSIARSPSDRFASAEEFGVAIAKAAADVWGRDWLDATDHNIEGSAAIISAVRSHKKAAAHKKVAAEPRDAQDGTDNPDQVRPSIADPSRTVVPGDISTAGLHAKETVAPQTSRPVEQELPEIELPEVEEPEIEQPDQEQPEVELLAPPAEVVRPEVRSHVQGADLNKIDPTNVVAVGDIIKPPRFPVAMAAVATLGILGALFVGWFGIGGDADDDAGLRVLADATAEGFSIIGDDPVEVDLDDSIDVSGLGAFDGNDARISFSIAGQQHVRTDLGVISGGNVELPPGASKWVVTGSSAATLEVLDPDDTLLASQDFEVDATSPPPYLTATGIGGGILALLTLASLESNLRPLRRGRMRITSLVGLAVFGALFGVVVVIAAAIFGGSVATFAKLTGAALLGAIGWAALGLMVRARSKRKRVQRRNARRA